MHRMPIKVLYSIPFSSERKRMSTIVKLSDGSVRLFCKGMPWTRVPCAVAACT